MLQVILQPHDKYSIAEQGQMAIEGGASWLLLRAAGLSDPDLRELARELVPLCTENGTILTMEGNVAMARELGLHGFLLHFHDNPIEVRAEVGPEAIIGAQSEVPERIVAYDKADIDYVAMTMRNPAEIVAAVRKEGCLMPFVAYGDFTVADVPELRFGGYNGLCTGKHIFDAPDPVAAVGQFLDALTR